MPRKFLKKGQGKQAYMAKAKHKKAEIKKETVKDMAQDYRIKNVEKKVQKLAQATKGWKVFTTNGFQDTESIINEPTTNRIAGIIDPVYIGNGEGTDDRQGDFVTIRSIKGRYSVRAPSNGGNGTQVPYRVRVMVLCSKKPNGEPTVGITAPTGNGGSRLPMYQDILAYLGETKVSMDQSDINAFPNPSTKGNFRVYYNKVHELLPVTFDAGDTDFTIGNDRVCQHGHFLIVPSKINSMTTYNDQFTDNPEDYPHFQMESQNQWAICAFSDNAFNTISPPSQTQPCQVDMNVITEYTQ
jgi:hypothetical protein